MSTTFIAFSTMYGVVMAADTDYTIHRLSPNLPLAAVANPKSPIPWGQIINDMVGQHMLTENEDIMAYSKVIEEFVCNYQLPDMNLVTDDDDRSIAIYGYGKEDLYPSVITLYFVYDSNTQRLVTDCVERSSVNLKNSVEITSLGCLDNVMPLLQGRTRDVEQKLMDEHERISMEFKRKVTTKFEGTPYLDRISKVLEQFDTELNYIETAHKASSDIIHEICVGLGSFSIEELALSAETLINSQTRLNALYAGNKANYQQTREIALVNRVEGLTWLKHSIYAL